MQVLKETAVVFADRKLDRLKCGDKKMRGQIEKREECKDGAGEYINE